MTFLEMARQAFGSMSEDDLRHIATLMEESYCNAMRFAAWRLGGVDYVFEGSYSKPLADVLEIIRKRKGPL